MVQWHAVAIGAVAVLGATFYLYTLTNKTASQSKEKDSTTTTESTTESTAKNKTKTRTKTKTQTKTAKRKKTKKKKQAGFQTGFLNGLSGLDSPSKPGNRRNMRQAVIVANKKQPPATLEQLEAEAIADFIQTSKSMQHIASTTTASDQEKQAALQSLQRRRQAIVAGLQNINGTQSIQKLEDALTTLNPPAPPPEPKELYRQSIAHRIMVDPKFKLNKTEPKGLEKEVSDTIRAAYWDSIRYKLNQNDHSVTATVLSSLIQEVCTAIIDLRGDGSDQNSEQNSANVNKFRTQMAALLSNTIDLPFLQQQCSHGQLTLSSLKNIFAAIVHLLYKCQSPERDENNKAWLEEMKIRLTNESKDGHIEQMTPAERTARETMCLVENVEFCFDGIFSMIEEIKLDLLNHQLDVMRVHLNQNGKGIQYHRTMFQARLDKGEIKLTKTINFVKRIAPEGTGIRHQHVCGLLHLLYFDVTGGAVPGVVPDAVATGVPGVPGVPGETVNGEEQRKEEMIPETLEIEAEDMDIISRKILDMISALALVLKTDQYVTVGLHLSKLTMEEKEQLYSFYYNLCSEATTEKVQEIQIPVPITEGKGKGKGKGDSKTTKTMLAVSKSDPHGPQGRKGRLEKSAIYACGVIEQRKTSARTTNDVGFAMTLEIKNKVIGYFFQMATDPIHHPVFKATTAIAKSAMLKCIHLFVNNAQRNAPEFNADMVSETVFSNGPLRPPASASQHFNAIMKDILTMSHRNFNIYSGWYGDLMKEHACCQ